MPTALRLFTVILFKARRPLACLVFGCKHIQVILKSPLQPTGDQTLSYESYSVVDLCDPQPLTLILDKILVRSGQFSVSVLGVSALPSTK